jgi:MOSC domain-containing protein YiiM/GNAT superfamily N-acetyltransferase
MPTGRVLQVNVSVGGVPKLPVELAWVGRLGLEGDAHREATVHGGPHRAVCLFGIEAIERLQAEGHPVRPGGVGENLTTGGVEWSLLPIGTRARIGDSLEIELASPTNPCATQKPNFIDGRFSRISIDLHPSDSRMYARVLHDGEVRPGDEIRILPPAPDSTAQDEALLARLDRAAGRSSLANWQAARAAGFDVRILADGELAMCAAPGVPGPAFNGAHGLARLPHLLPEVIAFFDHHATPGWLLTDDPPWPGAEPELVTAWYCAPVSEISDEPAPASVVVRRIEPEETSSTVSIHAAAGSGGVVERGAPDPWPSVAAATAGGPHSAVLLAEIDGVPVGTGSLFVSHRTGWMRAAAVTPDARGRGIQRALLRSRARLAESWGCDLVGASAAAGSISARNLERIGLREVGTRQHHRYAPARTALE